MTAQLTPPILFRAVDPAGAPLAFGQVFTYIAGTSTKQATYTDSSQTQQNTNPIVLSAAGQANVWLDPTLTYKFVIAYPTDSDPPTNPINTVDNVAGGISSAALLALLTAQNVGQIIFPQSLAEINAGVTPTYFNYYWGDVRRYGAVLNGVADDTTALQRWLNVGGSLFWPVAQAAFVTAALTMKSNTTIDACEGATITTATHDISILSALGKTNVTVRGLTILMTSVGTSPHFGGIVLNNTTYSLIDNCTCIGMQGIGVWLTNGANYNKVTTCTILNHLNNAPVCADISIHTDTGAPCNYNIIDGNFCYGGANSEFGVACWDPESGIVPTRNLITNNRIGPHSGYGVLIYTTALAADGTGNSYNEVTNNQIEGILGNIASNPSSGAGVYVVGIGAGGTIIANNQIRNCCISTGNETLAPAAIGINSIPAGNAPLIITGNQIQGMTQYHGIMLTGVLCGASVGGNTVVHPASNTNGSCIKIVNSANINVTGGTLNNLNTTTALPLGIEIRSIAAVQSNITISGVTIVGGFSGQIRTIVITSGGVTGLTIMGCYLTGGLSTCTPITMDSASAQNVLIQGNTVRADTQPAVSMASIPSARFVGNFLLSTGTITINFTGTNTSGYFDRANTGLTNDASVNNAGTGMVVERLAISVPSAGTWALGDNLQNRAPTGGGTFIWVCTTAGTGGGTAVFKTIANSA